MFAENLFAPFFEAALKIDDDGLNLSLFDVRAIKFRGLLCFRKILFIVC